MCYHYTIGPKPVFPACIYVYRAMLDTNSPCKPPSTVQQSLPHYFQQISKASRLLQSLNLSHFLWIKFFVDCIALQDFKPTTSGKCLYRHIIANLPYARATVFNQLLVLEQIYRLGIRTGFNVFSLTNPHEPLIALNSIPLWGERMKQ